VVLRERLADERLHLTVVGSRTRTHREPLPAGCFKVALARALTHRRGVPH